MAIYANLSGQSNVRSYEAGIGWITVTFGDRKNYTYTDRSAGPHNILQMQRLARAGRGLNGFINTNVKYRYESKR